MNGKNTQMSVSSCHLRCQAYRQHRFVLEKVDQLRFHYILGSAHLKQLNLNMFEQVLHENHFKMH